MAKLFWKIFLCMFIQSFIVCRANDSLNTTSPKEPSISTNTEAFLNDDTNEPLEREGTPEGTTAITVNGTIRTIRDLVVDGNLTIIAPVLVHATLENTTYLLINETLNHKTKILVYIAVDNTTKYLHFGILKTSPVPRPFSRIFTADRYEDIIDVIPKKSILPFSGDLIGNYIIDVKDSLLLLCPTVTVKYFYYTRDEVKSYQVFNLKEDAMNSSSYDTSKNTTILIHGWRNNGTEPGKFSQMIKNAILKTENQNVFVISWTASAIYPCALSAMKPVAERVANLVDVLVNSNGANINSFYIKGHSLGGQMVGYVGRRVKSGLIPRITSFDPANPFISCWLGNCIAKTDGKFVVVIHTDGGRTAKSEPLGHIDFYPNGGVHPQPHCGREIIITSCSHAAGFVFYEEALLNAKEGLKFIAAKSDTYNDFKEGKCSHMNEFGPNVKKEPQGSYFFTTSAKKPYARGYNGLSRKCQFSTDGILLESIDNHEFLLIPIENHTHH